MFARKQVAYTVQRTPSHFFLFSYRLSCHNTLTTTRSFRRLSAAKHPASVSSLTTNHHHSLSTFLEYASATALSRSSTVFVGTLYEYQCQDSLRRLGFLLERTGGAGDAGVDLAGTWKVPFNSKDGFTKLPVIVQCKALNRKTGPNMMRELEGTLAAHQGETIGVLCSTKTATKGVRDVLRNSKSPMIWFQVEQTGAAVNNGSEKGGDNTPVSDFKAVGTISEIRIKQMLWNEQVERIGASGLAITLLRGNPEADSEGDQIALLWNGQMWPPV